MARCRKTSLRISPGIEAIGHGNGGERSVSGSAGGMDSWENASISSLMLDVRTSACAGAGAGAVVDGVSASDDGGIIGLVMAATGG